MDSKVSALDTIPAIDRAADFFYIVDSSSGSSYKTTPNGALGITGDPVGTSDTQTLTSKTLTSPTISNPALSGTITGTYTLGGTPTFPAAVVTLTGTQTLTNKILTSPAINTPTINNPTLNTDAVSEFTSANGVTIDGLNIKDGKLNTNNSVVTANITESAVTADEYATDAQILAYVETTTGQSFATTGPVDATSMTITFTTPASCTKILLRAEATISSDTAAATNTLYITDGSNTVQVKRDIVTGQANVSALQHITVSRRIAVTASTSYTFKLRVGNSTGTTVLNQGNGATSPTELWVERA